MITWTKDFSNIGTLCGNRSYMAVACRIHGDVDIGKRPAKTFLEMEPTMLLYSMCCSQTSRLVLATGISVRVLNC